MEIILSDEGYEAEYETRDQAAQLGIKRARFHLFFGSIISKQIEDDIVGFQKAGLSFIKEMVTNDILDFSVVEDDEKTFEETGAKALIHKDNVTWHKGHHRSPGKDDLAQLKSILAPEGIDEL